MFYNIGLCKYLILIRKESNYMAESLIVRKGGSGSGSFIGELKTEIITSNLNWVVPKVRNNQISVRIFGGGGAGNSGPTLSPIGSSYMSSGGSGGGGGWMNNAIFTNLTPGQVIPIVIGIGGTIEYNTTYSGGTSTFGSYLSANGGEKATSSSYNATTGIGTGGGGGNGGSGGGTGGSNGGIGYQFGGGGSSQHGGRGGMWGGGGGGGINGGTGGTYGGGGGAGFLGTAGTGGTYGGGGGAGCRFNGYNSSIWKYGNRGIGGTYGGNGGGTGLRNNTSYTNTNIAQNGTNTSTWTNVFNDGNGYFRGDGLQGKYQYTNYNASTQSEYYCICGGGGGGGFGGNGGIGSYSNGNSKVTLYCYGGGGGGYGSNGGNAKLSGDYSGGGGGGGYGGDGGECSGGGGGYGKSAKGGNNYGGGGGYYSRGGHGMSDRYQYGVTGGGGGGYGNGGNGAYLLINRFTPAEDGGFAAGGGGGGYVFTSGKGGNGICIIQYYI